MYKILNLKFFFKQNMRRTNRYKNLEIFILI